MEPVTRVETAKRWLEARRNADKGLPNDLASAEDEFAGLMVMTDIELANLRIAAFAALKGWGRVREDGKWSAWNYAELREEADALVVWALSSIDPADAPKPETSEQTATTG